MLTEKVHRHERALLPATALLFVSAVTACVAVNNALGFDESVYAVLTRHWLNGTAASGWGIHRPPLLSIIGIVPFLAGGGSEAAMRSVGIISGVGTGVAAWWLARSIGGHLAGSMTAVTLASSFPFIVESSTFLTDVPSTCLLLTMTAIGWHKVIAGRRIGWGFVWVAPLAAAAFYMRYGAIVSIVALAVAAVVVAGDRLREDWRIIATTVALFVALLVPHAVVSFLARGTPWSILTTAQGAAGQTDVLPAIQYLAWFPWQLMGPLGAILAATGVVAIGRTLVRGIRTTATPQSSLHVFVGTAVTIQFAVLGTVVHAEPRYLFLPMILLIISGAVALASPLARYLADQRRVAIGGVMLGVGALLFGATMALAEVRDRQASWDWKRAVGELIGEAGQGDCSVLAADVPIITWYSRCPAYNFTLAPERDPLSLLRGAHRFVVFAVHGEHQPEGTTWRDRYLPYLERWQTLTDGRGVTAADIYQVRVGRDR